MNNKGSPVKIRIIAAKERLEMKALVISFVVGLLVGCIWGHSREESRAACR
jgi:hypothetical protein